MPTQLLIDTVVVIEHLRGRPEAITYLEQLEDALLSSP